MKNDTPVVLARAIALLAAISVVSACASLAARPRGATARRDIPARVRLAD
jgi:hypothetical protein